MDIPKQINQVFDTIEKQAKPVSIFVYGSRARQDHKKDSDFEVGVLFQQDRYVERKELRKLHDFDNLNLFPFIYEDFIKYKLDTPFPKAVFIRELVLGAKTARGEKVIEGMEPPEVRLLDLLEVVNFQLAYALAATHSAKQGDLVTAATHFTKSALFGARVLVILERKAFPVPYDEIIRESRKLDIDSRFQELLEHAMDVRAEAKIDVNQLFANITFLNQVVRQKVREQLARGDKVVLKGRTFESSRN